MNITQQDYLQALGIKPWQRRTICHDTAQVQEQAQAEVASEAAPATSNWSTLESCVMQCTACSLHETRTQTVFGVGNRQAKLMIIGEAPGFHEDKQGEPFVGRAGQLLTAMIKSIGLDRSQVFIANILKCRPPNNRDPQADEVAQCTPFLDQQISLIQPQLLLAVGRISAHYLLKTKSSLESLRNKTHCYGENNTPLIVTYHPAYLLRNPIDKKKAYMDLLFTQKLLKDSGEKPHGKITHSDEQTL